MAVVGIKMAEYVMIRLNLSAALGRNQRAVMLALLIALLPCAARAKIEHILTGDMPPFSIEHDAAGRGFLVELVEELGQRAGNPLRVEFVPWARAVALAGRAPKTAAFPLTRTPEREDKYRWIAKLAVQHFVFISQHSTPVVDDVSGAKGKRVGILRGSPHIVGLVERGLPRANIIEETTVSDLLKRLDAGTIDFAFGSQEIWGYTLNQRRGAELNYRYSKPLYEGDIWLGGAPDILDADIEAWRRAVQSAESDGTIRRLRLKYRL